MTKPEGITPPSVRYGLAGEIQITKETLELIPQMALSC
jgi:hypothetical protein